MHAGSLVAALASWLDARANHGRWLVRMEDVDTPRCVPGADRLILRQLADCGLHPDEKPLYQSQRGLHYQTALDRLVCLGLAYPCSCTRQQIAQAQTSAGQARERYGELVYPGTCRHGLDGRKARAWRLRTDMSITEDISDQGLSTEKKQLAALNKYWSNAPIFIANSPVQWVDRRLGAQCEDVGVAIGDFVLKRADGLWAYQLAVVVDDAYQGVTDVVRGEDLVDNTARQILLQRALGLGRPRYLHTPLVRAADGQKLSKQNDAQPLDTSDALAVLQNAGAVLGIQRAFAAAPPCSSVGAWLSTAVKHWRHEHNNRSSAGTTEL